MHNRKRAEGPIDPLIVAASRKKAEAYRGLSRLAFKQVSFDFSHSLPSLLVSQLAEGGDVSAQLLSLNPELYSLWNHRRRLIIQATSTPSVTPNVTSNVTSNVKLETDLKPSDDTISASSSFSSSSSSLISSSILLERELAVTEAAIKRNPKSYHAWHHRRWSITTLCGLEDRNHSTCLLIPTTPFNASQELALCEKLFLLDERNFHVGTIVDGLLKVSLKFKVKILNKRMILCYLLKLNLSIHYLVFIEILVIIVHGISVHVYLLNVLDYLQCL